MNNLNGLHGHCRAGKVRRWSVPRTAGRAHAYSGAVAPGKRRCGEGTSRGRGQTGLWGYLGDDIRRGGGGGGRRHALVEAHAHGGGDRQDACERYCGNAKRERAEEGIGRGCGGYLGDGIRREGGGGGRRHALVEAHAYTGGNRRCACERYCGLLIAIERQCDIPPSIREALIFQFTTATLPDNPAFCQYGRMVGSGLSLKCYKMYW